MRKAIMLAAAGVVLLGSACAAAPDSEPTSAAVSQRPAEQTEQAQPDMAWLQANSQRGQDVLATAERRLGTAYGGGYLDGVRRQIVVLTTEPGSTGQVRELGAQPRVVQRSQRELRDWQDQLNAALGAQPPRSVTNWGIDVPRNVVVVNVLPGQDAPPRVQRLVERSAGAVVLEPSSGPIRPLPGPAVGN